MSLCDAGGRARAWACAHSSMAPQPERAGKQARAGGGQETWDSRFPECGGEEGSRRWGAVTGRGRGAQAGPQRPLLCTLQKLVTRPAWVTASA